MKILFLDNYLAISEVACGVNDLEQVLPLRLWVVSLVIGFLHKQVQLVALKAWCHLEGSRLVLDIDV